MNHTKPRYPLTEAFKLLGIARSMGYCRIKEGALRLQKDGRRSYITSAEIDRYVACCGAEGAQFEQGTTHARTVLSAAP